MKLESVSEYSANLSRPSEDLFWLERITSSFSLGSVIQLDNYLESVTLVL